jgi:hypothetical protein
VLAIVLPSGVESSLTHKLVARRIHLFYPEFLRIFTSATLRESGEVRVLLSSVIVSHTQFNSAVYYSVNACAA